MQSGRNLPSFLRYTLFFFKVETRVKHRKSQKTYFIFCTYCFHFLCIWNAQ